jgi:DNA-binding NtrC family response regulator
MTTKVASRRVLVVDDEKLIRDLLEEGLQYKGYEVSVCSSATDALDFLEKESIDVILSDIKMDGMTGYEFLAEVMKRWPDQHMLMMTAYSSVDSALKATRMGAKDYIQKPFEVAEVAHRLSKSFENIDLLRERNLLRGRLEGREAFGKIIARNKRMQQIFDMIRTVAPSPSSVLIQGENGTGKELVARAVHHYSDRADQSFLAKNCAAIPDALLESELFGHVKGAFTGSIGDRKGIFEEAHGGTLFLDEISEMPFDLQSKLLRVLQEGEIQRVGSNETIEVDVRIISSTNRDMVTEVKDGRFRQDLFYRLNVIPVILPPLRDRIDDIPLLAEHFMRKYAGRMRRQILGITDEGMKYLLSRPWDGNVRELENTVERAVVMATGSLLDYENFRPLDEFASSADQLELPPVDMTIHEMEKRLILSTLQRNSNNRTRTAELLGISIRTLRNKLHEYRDSDPELTHQIDAK